MGKPRVRKDLRHAFTLCLTTLRKNAGYTQEGLAFVCGIDRGYLGQLERGHHSPTIEIIFRLLPALGITFVQFAAYFEKSLQQARAANRNKKADVED